MDSSPKPNTQALSWFYGEYEKGSLDLKPKYQRNPIWSIGQKCFLIDSIISGCPIPQIYINIKTQGRGIKKKTVYEVVDGQQRLRTILEFMSEKWGLVATTAKSYPVSDEYKPYIGKRYSELPEKIQDLIWNYQIAVQELRGWDDQQIRALFRRLNYVVEKLSKQELRHSQYFGLFVEAVEQLAQDKFWLDTEFFTRRDYQRMKDVEFISELFIVVIDGVQDQQKTLNRFYADYDVIFPNRLKAVSKFKQVLKSLETIKDVIKQTRFSKRADFYALFAAVMLLNDGRTKTVNIKSASSGLRELHRKLKVDPTKMRGTVAKYYGTVIEGPNKLHKRKRRTRILLDLLKLKLGIGS